MLKRDFVSVAQWIEHWFPVPKVAGSNPVGDTLCLRGEHHPAHPHRNFHSVLTEYGVLGGLRRELSVLRNWYISLYAFGLGCVLASCASDDQLAASVTNSPAPAVAQPAPLTVPVPRSLDDALRAGHAKNSQLREQALTSFGPQAPSTQPAPTASDKPALEIYRAGLERLLDTQDDFRATLRAQGMTDEQIDTYLGCIVEQTHSTMSSDFLIAVAPGKSAEATISQKDQETLDKAIDHCSTQW